MATKRNIRNISALEIKLNGVLVSDAKRVCDGEQN